MVKTAHDATQMDRLLQRELFSDRARFYASCEDGLKFVVVYANQISIHHYYADSTW